MPADVESVLAQVQCIMHFLQLPIEDQFLDQMERPQPASAAVAAGLHPHVQAVEKHPATDSTPPDPPASSAPASSGAVNSQERACMDRPGLDLLLVQTLPRF